MSSGTDFTLRLQGKKGIELEVTSSSKEEAEQFPINVEDSIELIQILPGKGEKKLFIYEIGKTLDGFIFKLEGIMAIFDSPEVMEKSLEEFRRIDREGNNSGYLRVMPKHG
jgi:hypothetical protein